MGSIGSFHQYRGFGEGEVINPVGKFKDKKVGDYDLEQKQRFRGVFMKRCSETMQQIYRRTPVAKCDFNKVALATLLKSHFAMGVLLKICCMFLEHLFIRTPASAK